MNYIVGILALLFCNSIFCQTNKVDAFIPSGYVILDSAGGDLNLDGRRDMVLILTKENVSSDSVGNRPLLILHGQRDGSFQLAEHNDSVILCYTWGGSHGDPYSKLTIKDNCFSIDFFGGYGSSRWTRTITFKYDLSKKGYYLHEDIGESWNQLYDTNKIEKHVYNKQKWNKTKFRNYVAGEK